jgi:hypothetical protein
MIIQPFKTKKLEKLHYLNTISVLILGEKVRQKYNLSAEVQSGTFTLAMTTRYRTASNKESARVQHYSSMPTFQLRQRPFAL